MQQYRLSLRDNLTAKLVLFNPHQRYERGDIGLAFLEALCSTSGGHRVGV